MKKKFLILTAVCLLLSMMLFAESSAKMITSFFPNYNLSKNANGEYQYSLMNWGMGCNYATVFTDDNGSGWGFNTKLDIGIDFEADKCIMLGACLDGAYYNSLDRNTGVMVSFGPAWVMVEERVNGRDDNGFMGLGLNADLALYLTPSPNFGFIFGSTLYAMPLIVDYTSATKQASPFFSVSSYVGFAFLFDNGMDNDVFIPHYFLY